MSTIVLSCPGCAKRYELSANLAGKKARCKACSQEFSIPVPRQVAPAAAPVSTLPSSPRPSSPRPSPSPRPSRPSTPPPPMLDEFNPYSDMEEDVKGGAAVSYDEDETYLPPRAGGMRSEPEAEVKKKKKKRKSSSSSSSSTDVSMVFLMIGVALEVAALVMAFASPSSARGALLVILLVGLLQLAGGWIWGLVTAFRESAICGLCFFFGPYALYYTASRWSDMKRQFTLYVIGALVIGIIPGMIKGAGLLGPPRAVQAGNGFAPINAGNPRAPHVGFQRHQPVNNPAPPEGFQPNNQPGQMNNMPGMPQNPPGGMNNPQGMPAGFPPPPPDQMNNQQGMPGPPPGFQPPPPNGMNNMPGAPNGRPPFGNRIRPPRRFGRPGRP